MAARPPDDALARLARWDELRRRAAGTRPAVDDLVHTVRELVSRHPDLSLVVTAAAGGATWHLRATHADGRVEVSVEPGAAAGAGAGEPPDPDPSPAARLAALLREHPGLLGEQP